MKMGFKQRIKKKLHNLNSITLQPLFRRIAGWDEIQEQIDSANFFLNQFLDITKAPKAIGELRQLQLVATEVLRIVLSILDNNGIECWLDYGTLLGAVRHKGFIPWDDDLDVAIKRSDFYKTIDVLQEECPKYGIEVGTPTPGRIWLCIWKAGVVLDIFPMDNVTASSISNHEELKKRVFAYRKYYSNHRDADISTLAQKRDDIIGTSNDMDPLWYHNAEFNADGSVYDNNTIFPLKKIRFEEYTFFVPQKCDIYLQQKYGSNYMEFPKKGILHHSGGNNQSIVNNSTKYNVDMDKLLCELRSIHL